MRMIVANHAECNQAEPETSTKNKPNGQRQELETDSKRAWWTLLVLFVITSSLGGSSRVYGLVFARQVEASRADDRMRELASWPLFTCSTVELLASILTPALANWLSWRQLEFIAALLFVASNLFAYLSASLALDILCLGVVQGVALSIHSVISLSIVNYYFRRYRTTAFGLALSGSTCGLVYLAPLAKWLLDSAEANAGEPQTFRLVYLGLAACSCVNLVLVFFLRPVNVEQANTPVVADWVEISEAKNQAPERRSSRKVSRLVEWYLEREDSIAFINVEIKTRRISTMLRQNYNSKGSHLCREEDTLAKSQSAAAQLDTWWPSARLFAHKISTHSLRGAQLAAIASSPNKPADLEMAHEQVMPVPVLAPAETGKITDGELSLAATAAELLGNPCLHCVWILLTLYYLVSRLFIIVLADFGFDRGLSVGQSSALLNYWSAGELFGRLALAALIDLRWLSMRACLSTVCALLAGSMGFLVLVEPAAPSWFTCTDNSATIAFTWLALCSFLIASLVSLEYVLINAFMVEYLGASRATSCYSLAAFVASFFLAARPTLIGLFRDKLGSYDGLILLLAGSALTFALLFYLVEPLLKRRWPRRPSGSFGGLAGKHANAR